MVLDEKFWVAISFVIFAVLVFPAVKHVMLKALDDRAKKIKEEIDQAKQLKSDAMMLLEAAKLKESEIHGEIQQMLKSAEEAISKMYVEAEAELNEYLDKKSSAATINAERIKEQAITEIRERVIDDACKYASEYISKNITEKEASEVFSNSLKHIVKIS